jgi:uncharacterized protein
VRPAAIRRLARLGAGLAALVLAAAALAEIDVPYLTGRVTDNAEVLSPAARARLDELLRAHEHATTNQVAVLTVPTLDGESIEDFAIRVFGAWKLGQKGKDNGVLLIVVPRDRRMRIEVGYGLESALPDVAAARIIRDAMAPRFKAGDLDGGVEAGVAAIIAQLTGAAPPPPAADTPAAAATPARPRRSAFTGPDLGLPERILLGGFIFGIIGLFTTLGIVTPGGWFLYAFLIPFWAMFPMIVVGVDAAVVIFVAYLIAFPVLKVMVGRTGWHAKAAAELARKGVTTIGGFTVTRGSSGSSWSSGSSGGGFSGGGGSSGGGGASGSW